MNASAAPSGQSGEHLKRTRRVPLVEGVKSNRFLEEYCIPRSGLLVALISLLGGSLYAQGYTSPYALTFTLPRATLSYDFASRRALDPSTVPVGQWYQNQTKQRWGAWGPPAVQYPAQENCSSPFFQQRTIPPFSQWNSAPKAYSVLQKEYLQQRVLAAAESYLNTVYQHHHIPQWNPYANGYRSSDPGAINYWPWLSVSYGQGSAGIDCSDFTSYVYNFALGIRLLTAVAAQGQEDVSSQSQAGHIAGPGGQGWIYPHLIRGPNYGTAVDNTSDGYKALTSRFEPGDLLFIRNMIASRADQKAVISHVVIWLGKYGTLTGGAHSTELLIINSHDNDPVLTDVAGNLPPPGVHILPFRADNWYWKAFDHALRILDVTPTL